jgi:hypothetical protein
MAKASMKIQEQYGEKAHERVFAKINDKTKVIRAKSSVDPFARGSRKYKATLR